MFCIKNQLTAAFVNTNNSILLGLNVQSLRCHHDGLLIEHKIFSKKRRTIAITETWLTENDSVTELTVPGYQPLESKPHTLGKEREGVAFFVQETVTYKSLIFETKIECLIIKVNFRNNQILYFCVVYQSHKLKDFVPQFEERLSFLERLKHNTVIFGDFNIVTLADSKSRNDYDKVLHAFDFKHQNLQAKRVTATSST